MTTPDVMADFLASQREAMIDLCLELGNLPDLSGCERPVAEALLAAYEDAGLDAHLQEIDSDSANVVAVLHCGRSGPGAVGTLILNSHLDTEGGIPRCERDKLRGTWREGELLVGKGLVNAKAHLVAQLFAVRAIQSTDREIGGDIILTGVAQETGAPVREADTLTGGPHTREGTGATRLVEGGVVGDFALVGEPNGFAISTAQAGYLRVRVTVEGFMPYTPFIHRGDGSFSSNPNPFERAAHVVVALTEWARDYELRHRVELPHGTIVPKAQVQGMHSDGVPFTERVDLCHVFVDIRLAPGFPPMQIVSDVRDALAGFGEVVSLQPYDYRRGFVAQGAEPLISAITAAHMEVFGKPPSAPDPSQVSMWQDTNVFNEAGIPSVSYGIKPVPEHYTREGTRALAIGDLLALARVYALTALEIFATAPHPDQRNREDNP